MKLNLTVPERPGMIYFIPGFDFLALVLALVMFTGVTARESFIDIDLPRSEFRGSGIGDASPVILEVRKNGSTINYYLGRKLTPAKDLEEALLINTEERDTRVVILRIDQSAPLWVELKLTDLCVKLDLTPKRAFRTEELSAP